MNKGHLKPYLKKIKVESEYLTILKRYSLNTNTATATGYPITLIMKYQLLAYSLAIRPRS